MFIDDTVTFEIEIYCHKNRKYAYTEKEFKSLDFENKDVAKYGLLKLKMKELTWGMHNDIQNKAMTEAPNGISTFNYKIFKEEKLLRSVVDWDAVDKEGKKREVNIRSISALCPCVAEAIVRAYDEYSYVGDDEEKK